MPEIIPKEKPKFSQKLNILFYISLVFLILSIASFFALDYFQGKSQKELQDLEKTLEEGKTPERVALEKEILDYQRKLTDFPLVLEKHLFVSNFFTFLEKVSHPGIQFSQVDLSSSGSFAKISGSADSFRTLNQQLQILKGESFIKDVNLSNISLGERGEVRFTLNFTLDPKIFK